MEMKEVFYLNNKVLTTLKLSNTGVGVFAIKDISKGQILQEDGEVMFEIPREELNNLQDEVKNIILDRNIFARYDTKLTFYNPNKEFKLLSFINHSDKPNTNGVLALRDIKKGEELTEDYKDEDMDASNKEHYKEFI